MSRFVGSFENRVDKKGRVSVPAPFRAVVARQTSQELYLGFDPETGAIDAWTDAFLSEVEVRIDQLPIGSRKREALEMKYFSDPFAVQIDGDGRIVLPQKLRDNAGIGEVGLFVARGKSFQLWDPDRLAARKATLAAEVTDLELPPVPGGRS